MGKYRVVLGFFVLVFVFVYGCTGNKTSEPAPAPTAVPTVCAVAFGYTDYNYDDNYIGGVMAAVSLTASDNASITRLVALLPAGASGTFGMGIYSDNAGVPGTLLAQTAETTAVSGWNEAAVPAFSAVSGTVYWLVLAGTSTGICINKTVVQVGNMVKTASPYTGGMPAAPTGWIEGTAGEIKIYAVSCN